MHVALLFEYSSLNGGERSMLSVLDHLLPSADLQVTALAPSSGPLFEQLQQRNIPVVDFSVRDSSGQRYSPEQATQALSGLCQSLRPDVLHANSLSMARLTGRLRRSQVAGRSPMAARPDSPATVYTGHLRDIIGLNTTAVGDLNENDALVAVSVATRQFHVEQGLQPHRCAVIHNGVDSQLFRPRDLREQRVAVLPEIPADAVVLLTVGQICLRKAQADIAAAVLELLAEDPRCPIHWVVAGERYSGKPESIAYEQSLRSQFAAAGYSDRLHLLGTRPDVPHLMNAADLLVHTPRQEPFGRVLLEAAASQLPIVATHVGGTPEMLRHGQEALLVTPGDVPAIAAAVRFSLQNPAESAWRSRQARERVVQHYSAATAATQLLTLWQAAVEQDLHEWGKISRPV